MEWAPLLIESDRAYFEAGAELRQLRGAVLAHVPGFEALAASAVVHRVDPRVAGAAPRPWLRGVEAQCRHRGLGTARLYLDSADSAIDVALQRLGYSCQAEVGFVQRAAVYRSDVLLEPIASEAGWQQKLALHAQDVVGPDGHPIDAALWTALEQRRQVAGYQTAYLAMQRGAVVGTIAFAKVGGLFRLKNIVVAASHRRRGVGAAMVRAGLTLAHREGMAVMGCFGLAGAQGESLYRSTGFHAVTTQFGWSLALVPVAATRRPSEVPCPSMIP